MKILVCYNPYSSTQKISKNKDLLKRKLSLKYDIIDFFESTSPKSITEKISKDGNDYDTILVSGGDGTLNEAVTGVMRGNIITPISYIPSGTVNDVGSILKLKKNVKKSLNTTLDGVPVKMDVCKVNDSYFIYVCAAGKFTSISYDIDYKLKKKWGKFAYFIRAVQELPKEAGVRIRIKYNDEVTYSNSYVMFGFNWQQFGGFRFYRRKKPKLNDGIMDFTFIEKTKRWNIGRTIGFMLHGDLAKNGIRTISSDKISIEMDKSVDFNVDGEYAFTSDKVDFSVIKEGISIIVPRKTYKRLFKNEK